jgi:hypothetical protein
MATRKRSARCSVVINVNGTRAAHALAKAIKTHHKKTKKSSPKRKTTKRKKHHKAGQFKKGGGRYKRSS